MSVKIRFLGGAQEIGRNAIEIDHDNSSLLLDYGASFNSTVDFAMPVQIKKLKGIICSHAHLDHTAGFPLIYSSSLAPPLFINSTTLDLTNLLIQDFIKISKNKLQFDSTVLPLINEKARIIEDHSEFHIDDFFVKVVSAGHIPGSWVTFIEVGGKKILYTGDINVYDSFLLKGAEKINEDVDLMICESTYACLNHIPRARLIEELVNRSLEVLDNGGNVLIPSFSVGRSQEIACMFTKNNVDYPIYMDGMARTASEIILNHPESVRDYSLLKESLSKVKIINGKKDRKEALEEPSVIISPAGMLKGGAATYYISRIIKEPKNAVFFVGYLAKDTPGREMLEKRIFQSEKGQEPVKSDLDWFGISSHADMKGLIDYIRAINPEKLVLIHGEPFRMLEMSKIVEQELGLDCILPNNG